MDLAWKDLLNSASLSERGVVFAMSTGLSRSSHPRAGWGYASYTTGTAPRCPLFLLLLCVLFVKLRTGGKNKKASSTSASGVLCREALRTNYKRRLFLRHEALSLFRQSPGSAEPPPRGPRCKRLLVVHRTLSFEIVIPSGVRRPMYQPCGCMDEGGL